MREPQEQPEYQPGDRVTFDLMWWWMKESKPYQGTVIDAVWDDKGFYYYHMRDITGSPEKISDGGIVLEHEIIGSRAMQAMKEL